MEDIVAREAISLFHNHNLGTQQLSLNSRAQTTRATTNDQNLHNVETWAMDMTHILAIQYYIVHKKI